MLAVRQTNSEFLFATCHRSLQRAAERCFMLTCATPRFLNTDIFSCVPQVAEFTEVLQQLPMSSLLAAAFVTYLGRDPEYVRQAALAQWCTLLGVPDSWRLTGFLSSETELLTWKAEGMHAVLPPTMPYLAKRPLLKQTDATHKCSLAC